MAELALRNVPNRIPFLRSGAASSGGESARQDSLDPRDRWSPTHYDVAVVEPDWIEIKDLVAAGLLEVGTVLLSRSGKWGDKTALIRSDGWIEVDGKPFDTPSGAGKYTRGGATNGWFFWRLNDGRTLKDVREVFRAGTAS